MNPLKNETAQPIAFNEIFDCNKMKSLIGDNREISFTERFKKWISEYTKDANEKTWRDIEYFQAE